MLGVGDGRGGSHGVRGTGFGHGKRKWVRGEEGVFVDSEVFGEN